MTIGPDTYVEAVYYIAGDQMDWMGTIFREGDGPWQSEYRFRYYNPKGTGPFNSGDRKSWYEAKGPDNSEKTRLEITTAFMKIGILMAEKMHSQLQTVIVQGDGEKFFKAMQEAPWAHMKVEKKS